MSANIALYSSHHITEEELAEVIQQAGGISTTSHPISGRVSHGRTHVWIQRIPCYDGVFDWEGNPLNEEDIPLLDRAKAMLGGEFQTWISIVLSTTSGSQRLAVRFAYTCCQHWPCVIDNNQGKLFSCKDIERLYREDGGFTGYGL